MDSKIFRKLSYGLYVIGSTRAGKLNGQIANTVFQISSDPATVAISINKNNLTHEFITESKVFTVSILPKSVPLDLIGHFGFKSGREIDKYESVSFKLGDTGAPYLLQNSGGYLEAEVINSMDVETHTVFIGKVINAQIFNDEEPMTYAYYQQAKRGSASSTVPRTSTDENQSEKSTEKKQELNISKKFKCSVCGYIYDPAVGDPDSGIAPGTAFEAIPDDWVCPICGVSKDQFEPVD